jgi:hypothetical protein
MAIRILSSPATRVVRLIAQRVSPVAFCALAIQLLPLGTAFGLQQLPMKSISSAPVCPACKIQIVESALLQLPSDSLSFGWGTLGTVTRLPDGRFVVTGMNETPVPAVMTETGKFSHLLGRTGEGPGEFGQPEGVAIAPGDSIWLFEGPRKHVFTPDARWVRTERPTHWIFNGLVGPTGQVLIHARIGTPDRAGYPLHIVRPDGELGVSFGIVDPVLDPRTLRTNGEDIGAYLARRYERADDNSFWVYSNRKFLLERYDFNGRMLDQARHAMDGWYGEESVKRPGVGEFKGLPPYTVTASKQPGVLWLVYGVPNDSFRKPDSLFTPTDREALAMSDLVIEALDTRTMKVIATTRLPRSANLPLKNAPDMIAIYTPVDADGVFMTYSIRTMSVVKPPQ